MLFSHLKLFFRGGIAFGLPVCGYRERESEGERERERRRRRTYVCVCAHPDSKLWVFGQTIAARGNGPSLYVAQRITFLYLLIQRMATRLSHKPAMPREFALQRCRQLSGYLGNSPSTSRSSSESVSGGVNLYSVCGFVANGNTRSCELPGYVVRLIMVP